MPQSASFKGPIDPLELFRSLHISDQEIKDLWLGQGDALRCWNASRDEKDVVIVLNTGAGKTLVSLLIAQSIVNETGGHVLYACTTNQLVQQTAAKAAGYGLAVTTYFARTFSNDRYQEGLSPCITNYQAIFNGKSKFFRDELSAIIFDDAHAAEHIIRHHFSLTVTPDTFTDTYESIRELFRGFFTKIGQEISYRETFSRPNSTRDWLVPPFAVRENLGQLQEILWSAGFHNEKQTLFAWEYVKDRIDLCSLIINAKEVCITPAFVPVSTLPYFADGVRRIYLSATLSADDGFVRTFGRRPTRVIQPKTTAGECERLVIIPSRNSQCGSDVDVAKQVIKNRKALILVPGYRNSETWADIAKLSIQTKWLMLLKNSRIPRKRANCCWLLAMTV